MKRTVWLEETKRMRFEEAYEGWTERRLTQEEAAQLLGGCARTFRRYINRYEEAGLDGLLDKRRPQVSHSRALDDPGRTLSLVGIPGILLALVVYRKLHEPERGAADGLARKAEVQPFWFSLKTLMSSPTFRHLSFATGLYTVLWLGVVQWLPSFFTRSFGLEIGAVGTWLALILSLSQLIGMLLGGYLADRLGAADLRWYVWVPALAILVSTPMFALTFLTQNPALAFLSLFLPFMIGVMQSPPSFAVAQGLADVRMRAMAAALLLLITNLIGGGIGPQAVGIMSDHLAAQYGRDSLRYALLAVSLLFGLWSSLHYFLAGKTIRREFKRPE